MVRVLVLALLLAGCAQTAARSGSASGAASLAAAAPGDAKDKKLCRADTDLGSIMSKRVCRTASEWAAIDAANSENAHRALEDRQRGAADRPE